MNYVTVKHIDFVPGKLTKDGEAEFIYVFTHKKNKRIYKKPMLLGGIKYFSKIREYGFITLGEFGMGYESLMIISEFIYRLNKKLISYDSGEGEITDGKSNNSEHC